MFDKLLTKAIVLSVLIIFSSPLLAKHLVPKFSGLWFSQPKRIDIDNCGIGHFEYLYPLTKDPKTLAKLLLQDVSPHDFCIWNNAHIINNHSDINSRKPSNLTRWKQKITHSIYTADRYLQEKSINDIFSKSFFNLNNADRLTRDYIKNINITRTDKLVFLWDLAKNHRSDEARFNYILSCLRLLHPIELTDSLINDFYQQNSTKNKIGLMQVLEEMVYQRAKNMYFTTDPTLTNIANTNIPKIYNFYRELLLYDKNITILKEAILTYPIIFPSEQAKYDIDQALQRTNIAGLKRELLTEHGFYAGQLAMIFSTPTMQKQYLKDFLNNIESQNTDVKKIFNDTLYSYFADEDFNIPEIGFDGGKIDDEVRPYLAEYLKKQQPQAFKIDHYPTSNFLSEDGQRYYWLETYIATQTHNITEKNKQLAQYIKETNDLYYQASLLSCATTNIYAQFTIEDILKLKTSLDNKIMALRRIPVNASKKECIIMDMKRLFLERALSRLNQALKTKNQI